MQVFTGTSASKKEVAVQAALDEPLNSSHFKCDTSLTESKAKVQTQVFTYRQLIAIGFVDSLEVKICDSVY